MKVLIIPEDPTYNGYILTPLVKHILEALGKPNAFVHVLRTPRVQGYASAKALLPEIATRYRHMDLLLFLPDNDCKDKSAELAQLEAAASACGVTLLTCAAVQEAEVWLLAGHADRLPALWSAVRSECSPKEIYFEPFLREYGDGSPGGGRERLMRETLRQYRGLLARCPELRDLQERIRAKLTE